MSYMLIRFCVFSVNISTLRSVHFSAIKKLVIFSACVSRFDPDGAGAVKTNHFLKVLGLDESGVPRPSTTPRYISMGNACVVKNPSELEKVNIFSSFKMS